MRANERTLPAPAFHSSTPWTSYWSGFRRGFREPAGEPPIGSIIGEPPGGGNPFGPGNPPPGPGNPPGPGKPPRPPPPMGAWNRRGSGIAEPPPRLSPPRLSCRERFGKPCASYRLFRGPGRGVSWNELPSRPLLQEAGRGKHKRVSDSTFSAAGVVAGADRWQRAKPNE